MSPSTSTSYQDNAVTLGCAKLTTENNQAKDTASLPSSLSIYYLETGSPSELEAVSAPVTSQQDPKINLSLPSVTNAGVTGTHSHIWLFILHGFWGFKLKFSCLYNRCSDQWAICLVSSNILRIFHIRKYKYKMTIVHFYWYVLILTAANY